MGARESRSQPDNDDHDHDDTTPQDYYAILQVEENASADEIRVSLAPILFLFYFGEEKGNVLRQ
jgi:hypothetical protein